MDVNKLKHVVGKAETGLPATIRLFSGIDEYTACYFNEEFLWLQDYVKPSKIIVQINSEGGSVLYGMSIFSVIQSCPIEVECVNEGLAASMASVIWSAGDRSYMRDYSILMIHNPFCATVNDPDVKAYVSAFKTQLETIYNKRFGLDIETVKAIMDGPDGVDGTYFDADQAVKAGILAKDNIIKTSQQVRDKVKAQLNGARDACNVRNVMNSIITENKDFKPEKNDGSIPNKINQINSEMEKHEEKKQFGFDAVTALLGMAGNTETPQVSARISDLISKEKELENAKAALAANEIKLTGETAKSANLEKELNDVKADLNKYVEAEKAAKDQERAAMVEDAISAGKIANEAREQWVQLAERDFETVKATLASIPAVQKISNALATQEVDEQEKQKSTISEVEAAINKAVGADFEFGKLPS